MTTALNVRRTTESYVGPIVAATCSVFSTMLRCQITAGPAQEDGNVPAAADVSGIIGLSGKATGALIVNMDTEMALSAAEAMLGSKPTDLNAEVADVVGEITNMIAGGTKSSLSAIFRDLAIPMIILGRNRAIQFPSSCRHIRVPFDTPWGQLSVELEVREPAC